MKWRAHFIFGFLLFFIISILLFNYSNLDLLLLSIFAGFIALIPDLDHELSKSKKILDKLVPLLSFIILFSYSQNLANAVILTVIISGIYFIIFTFLKPKHRGITHSIFFLVLLSTIVYFFDINLGYAFFTGYFSHLLGDKTIKLF